MNTTAKTVTFVLVLCTVIGSAWTSRAPAHSPGAGSQPGFCDNLVDCIVENPFVQEALEVATHERYTDAEAVAAMGDEAHENSLNHQRYTDQEARGAVGPVGMTGYEIVRRPPVTVTLGFGEFVTVNVSCPKGKVLLGGGGQQAATNGSGPVAGVPMVSSGPNISENAWSCQWASNSLNAAEVDLAVFVICADGDK